MNRQRKIVSAHLMAATKRAVKPTKRRRNPDEVRARILAAARAMFAQQGYDGATTRSIAKAANVKLSLLLYHFKCKQNLWKATVGDIFVPYVAGLRAVTERMAGRSAAHVLREIIVQMVRFFAQYPELHRIMIGEGHHKSWRLSWLCEMYVDELFESLCGQIAAAQAEGRVRSVAPERLRYAIISMAALPFSMKFEFEHLAGKALNEGEEAATVDFITSLIFI